LSDKAKEKALEKLWDLNVSHDWWDATYEDAERVGLKLSGFDLDRRRGATGDFQGNAKDTAESILKEHGEQCETRKTAETYLRDLSALEAEYTAKNSADPEYDLDDDRDFEEALSDLNADFLRSILEDYSIILQKEYEYLTSEAQIIESIEANDYDFNSAGGLE
jgi:hypothetical protein